VKSEEKKGQAGGKYLQKRKGYVLDDNDLTNVFLLHNFLACSV